MSINIIKDALEYYDTNNERCNDVIKEIKYARFFVLSEARYITFFDKHRTELFTSQVELIGKYYNKLGLWVWGWSIPSADYSSVSIIRNVLFYGTSLEINEDNKLMDLKNELVTSRMKITNNVQLEIYSAIASYLSKQPFVLAINDLKFNDSGDIVEISLNLEEEHSVRTYLFLILDKKNEQKILHHRQQH